MARNLGALDNYLAGIVVHSKLSDKIQSFSIYGDNPDIDTVAIEDVWQQGGRYDYLTSASVLDISSSSALDAVGQAGLEMVQITGVDADYLPINEVVSLNGLTPSSTTNEYLRIHTMVGIKQGAADLNAKSVGVIQAVVGANVQAVILADDIVSHQAFFTIYAGYTGFIKQAWTSGGANDDFVIRFAVRPENGVFTHNSDAEITNSNFVEIAFNPGIGNIKEKSDVKVEAIAVSMNAQVRVNYTLMLIKNDFLQSLADSI